MGLFVAFRMLSFISQIYMFDAETHLSHYIRVEKRNEYWRSADHLFERDLFYKVGFIKWMTI